MKKVPVFLINGFLDAGKTQFILATIKRDEFYTQGRSLLICCEQGENEYDEQELARYNTKIVYLESEEDFNATNLTKIYKENKANRIIIEMNFMWDQNKISFPDFMNLSQIITIVDGKSFPYYYANMRQKFTDIIKVSDVVAFTKLENDKTSIAQFETGLKMTNGQCLYCLIDENCISTCEAFDTPLPYDIESDEIEIKDDDFGIFYIDTFDNRKNYEGKIVTFNAWVVKSRKLPKNQFIAGRKALTCCANDVQLYGFLVNDNLGQDLKDDSWVKIKAKCHIEYNTTYEEEELVLTPLTLEIIPQIEKPVLDLR